jgi:cell division protein FtsB
MKLKEWAANFLEWANRPRGAVVIVAVSLLLLLVYSRGNIKDMIEARAKIRELTQQKEALEQQIEADSTLLENLKDPEFLEKFARENYLMRREGEEVYIIKNKE